MQDVLALVGFVAAVYLVGQAAELLRCPGLLGELLAGVSALRCAPPAHCTARHTAAEPRHPCR